MWKHCINDSFTVETFTAMQMRKCFIIMQFGNVYNHADAQMIRSPWRTNHFGNRDSDPLIYLTNPMFNN